MRKIKYNNYKDDYNTSFKPQSTRITGYTQNTIDEFISKYQNGKQKTIENLEFIVRKAIKSDKIIELRRIDSEVRADSNQNTKSKTAVFISRCLKELNLDKKKFSSVEKWLYKVLNASKSDLLCNTELLLKLGRHEKKTFNKKIVTFPKHETSIKVLFEFNESKHDSIKVKESLSKPYGKLELLLEMAIHREFIQQYSKLNHDKKSILKYKEIKDPNSNTVFQRPYIVLPTSTIREWIWGGKNIGSVKRIKNAFLKFNRERLVINIESKKTLPDGFIKFKNLKDGIRPYEIETISIKLKTNKGERKAKGYKIMMHEFFFNKLIEFKSENKYKTKIFEKLKELSEREIKLYLLFSNYNYLENSYIVLNKDNLRILGMDIKNTKTYNINMILKRRIKSFNKKMATTGIKITISENFNRLYLHNIEKNQEKNTDKKTDHKHLEKLSPQERRQKILKHFKSNNKVYIEDIKGFFPNVSKKTVRRDLKTLQKKGKIELVGNTKITKGENRAYWTLVENR